VLAVDADDNGEISPGDQLRATIVIYNGAGRALTDVRFRAEFGRYLHVLTDSVESSQGGIAPPGTALLPDLQLAIGEMEPGATVTIQFSVLLNENTPPSVRELVLQGTVSAAGMKPVLTDDADTPETGDPTRLRIGHGSLSERVYLPIASQ
jgi:hypothetical protein